jgi:hypothetical protein
MLAVLLASLMLASCATVQPVGATPWALLEDCVIPRAAIQTNRDLIAHIRELRSALVSCNDDKKGLREWADTLP